MFGIRLNKWGWLLVALVAANVAYYFYSDWCLVTVKVTNAPLSKVIRSIEWQGWVKIYTNLPPDAKVSMYVDHVPLSEAMESLAANVDVPPSDNPDDGARPNRRGGALGANQPGIPPVGAATTNAPAGAPTPDAGPNAGNPGGPPGGGRGGFGGGGGGRRAEWNLAFFVAPTSAQVRQEIIDFETGSTDENNKVFTYGSQIALIGGDNISTAPDPRSQAWPGYKPRVDPPAAPDAPANATTNAPAATDPATPPVPPVPMVQNYLQAFAQSANIWIMAPGTWDPTVASPTSSDSSIIHAVENFVSNAHGAVTQTIILRAGRGGARGGPPGNVAGGDDAWADRMRNAINGLPPDQRPDALEALNQEVDFRKNIQTAPPEKRRQIMTQHILERMLYGERLSRLSPEKRAKVYQRMIANRQAAKAQK